MNHIETIRLALDRALQITAKEPIGPSNEMISAAIVAMGQISADAERLDWMEHELNANRYRMDIALQSDEEDGVWFAKFYRRSTGAVHGIPYDPTDSRTQTVRAALDAAMRLGKSLPTEITK